MEEIQDRADNIMENIMEKEGELAEIQKLAEAAELEKKALETAPARWRLRSQPVCVPTQKLRQRSNLQLSQSTPVIEVFAPKIVG